MAFERKMATSVVTEKRTLRGDGWNSSNSWANSTNGAHTTNGQSSTNGSGIHTNGVHVVSDRQVAAGFPPFVHHVLVPLGLLVMCPLGVMLLWYTAVKCDGSYMVLLDHLTEGGIIQGVDRVFGAVSPGSWVTSAILLGYITWALLLMVTLPGPRSEGSVTPKGNVPIYRDNGFSCFVVTMTTLVILTPILKSFGYSPTIVYDRFDEILATLNITSLFFCAFLQLKGLYHPSSSDHGTSGNPLFDYYWGTELYPRIWGIDIKVFTNCRFGMTVWPICVYIFALKSYELHGFVDSMWVSAFLQMVYFTKFFWWEAGYMKTIDIMMDRAGFYICWGCLVFIPGLYASVSLYLVNQPVVLGPIWCSVILTAGLAALSINYWADYQKQAVRDSNGRCMVWGRSPEVIKAYYRLDSGEERQSLLLVCGWWGLARHFHYVPEILLAFCWTAPALFSNLMPYSYLIFLTVLLVHRTFRDDCRCSRKYGSYWRDYCQRVPYRMIPKLL